jgi:ATP-dependent Clp protease ATP-binding subunit ClpB
LNRLDEIILFHRLDRAQVRRIVDVQITRFEKRLKGREIGFEVTEAAKDFLGNVGFDPAYGARPLKRAIQKHLENPLAQEILAGRYAPGDTIVVEVAAGELAFGKKRGGQPSAHAEA